MNIYKFVIGSRLGGYESEHYIVAESLGNAEKLFKQKHSYNSFQRIEFVGFATTESGLAGKP